MITIDQLKESYIMPLLATVPQYSFRIFTDAGDYDKASRRKNSVTNYINGLFLVTESEIQKLGGGMEAIGIVTQLRLLIPCGDETDENGDLPELKSVREALSEAFSNNTKMSVTENGKTYVGSVTYSLPTAGIRNMRSMVSDCLEYTVTIGFGYIQNALNTSDVSIKIDGSEIAFTSVLFTRGITPSGDLYSKSANGEALVYGENTQFAIDMEAPLLNTSDGYSSALLNYVLGLVPFNTPHTVEVTLGTVTRTVSMIFGECSVTGEGVSNTACKISLLPYATGQTMGG